MTEQAAAAGDFSSDEERGHVHHGSTAMLAFGAVGVVYGDIGTSPLYAM